jgi:2-keto-4-pentenoate hydratase
VDRGAQTLAARLVAARDPRAPAVSPRDPALPRRLDAAYRVQAEVVRQTSAGGWGRAVGRPWGWKVAAASPAAQRWHGIDHPIRGRMFEGGLLQSPARLPAGRYRPCLIEPEVAFTLGRELPPRARPYGVAEVAAAVATLHPAMEIAASAYGEHDWLAAPLGASVADNIAHAGLVLAEGRRDFARFDLAGLRVELWVDGRRHSVGQGANALGSPLLSLTWLANALARDGLGLRQGEVVTTGLLTGYVDLKPGQRAEAFYGPFGACRVSIGGLK